MPRLLRPSTGRATSSRCRSSNVLRERPPSGAGTSGRVRRRVRQRRRAVEIANTAIRALNELYAPHSKRARERPVASSSRARVQQVLGYVFECAMDYVDADTCEVDAEPLPEEEGYDVARTQGPVDLVASLVSLPEQGGGFPAADHPSGAGGSRGPAGGGAPCVCHALLSPC